MNVGIVGLGLIGGSMAKAYSEDGHTVYGGELDASVVDFAMMAGACAGHMEHENIGSCELILIAIPPRAAIQWLTDHAALISKEAMVIDLCGTKRVVCEACFPLAEKYGFTFVGGHPMAGTHNSGFKYAKATLFKGAPMVLVPPRGHDMNLLDRVQELLSPAGFGKYSVTTAEDHDHIIAFTSQMCHVVSNAYIKSPTALMHKGFSAGSYKDLTRVAWLNPSMWAELMLENRDFMLSEMDVLIESLSSYRKAIAEDNFEDLRDLLDVGRRRKEEVDGR